MISSRLKHPRSNPEYRGQYQKLIWVLITAMGILLGLMCLIMYQISHRKEPIFYAEQPNGKTMELTAYTSPTVRSDVLLRWASKAAVAAYTFDFVNYPKQFELARPYFTETGWEDYQRSVERLINVITQNKLFVNGVVVGPPVMTQQGEYPGKGKFWRVQLPFLVTYQSSEQTRQERYTVILNLVEVSPAITPSGVGIDQFIMV